MEEFTAVPRCSAWESCEQPPLPGAPFPICLVHAAQVFGFVRKHADIRRGFDASRAPSQAEMVAMSGKAVVYYIAVDGLIKIGWTKSLHRRLTAYPPTQVLLAIERGSALIERQRHTQFKHLRVGHGEWFSQAPELDQHIESLRN